METKVLTNVNPIKPRKTAPAWKATAVENEQFVTKSSADLAGKYYILLFYPFDFTFVCPTELISFSEAADEFRKLDCEVIGVSCDSAHSHLKWVQTSRKEGGLGGMNIPLLADFSKEIARNYGVLVEDADDPLCGAPLRGLIIVDGNGVIRSITINDAPVGRSVDETLRVVEAFKFTDKYGEVCPANWKPGKSTIKPDHAKKGEFFEKEYN